MLRIFTHNETISSFQNKTVHLCENKLFEIEYVYMYKNGFGIK